MKCQWTICLTLIFYSIIGTAIVVHPAADGLLLKNWEQQNWTIAKFKWPNKIYTNYGSRIWNFVRYWQCIITILPKSIWDTYACSEPENVWTRALNLSNMILKNTFRLHLCILNLFLFFSALENDITLTKFRQKRETE